MAVDAVQDGVEEVNCGTSITSTVFSFLWKFFYVDSCFIHQSNCAGEFSWIFDDIIQNVASSAPRHRFTFKEGKLYIGSQNG